MDLVVLSVEPLTGRIAHLRLGRADGGVLPPAQAGAHVEIALDLDERTVVHRAYSLLNPSASPACYEIAVQREDEGRGGSRRMHRLAPGTPIQVFPPKNDFALAQGAQEHRLIAGGIGITPMLAMARALTAGGERFRLDYLCRDRAGAAFVAEVESMPTGTCWFDGGDPSAGADLRALLACYEAGHHAYVCGPAGLIVAVTQVARELGWPESAVHYELFSGALPQDGERPYRVIVEGTGLCLEVGPHETMLQVLEKAGVDILSDCRRGSCGVCVTQVVAGVPDHRDESLTAAERAGGQCICPCVSRSLSDELVIRI